MKSQKSEVRSQKFFLVTRHLLLVIALLLVTCHSSLVTAANWSGVDESVVEKYAEEHGRAAKEPFINTDQGDLLLFMFLVGGAIGGFAAGYYWRVLVEPRTKNKEPRAKSQEHRTQSKGPRAKTQERVAMHNFKNLKIYQKAIDFAVEIYELTKVFPKQEQFGLTDQIRRAVTSIALNE